MLSRTPGVGKLGKLKRKAVVIHICVNLDLYLSNKKWHFRLKSKITFTPICKLKNKSYQTSYDLNILKKALKVSLIWLKVGLRWPQYRDRGKHTPPGTCFGVIAHKIIGLDKLYVSRSYMYNSEVGNFSLFLHLIWTFDRMLHYPLSCSFFPTFHSLVNVVPNPP